MQFIKKITPSERDISLAYVGCPAFRSKDAVMIRDMSNRIDGNDHPVTVSPAFLSSDGTFPIPESSYDLLVTDEIMYDGYGIAQPLWYRFELSGRAYVLDTQTVTRIVDFPVATQVSSMNTGERTITAIIPVTTGKTANTWQTIARSSVKLETATLSGTVYTYTAIDELLYDVDYINGTVLVSTNIPGSVNRFRVAATIVRTTLNISSTGRPCPLWVEVFVSDRSPRMANISILSQNPDPLYVSYTAIDDNEVTSPIQEWVSGDIIFRRVSGNIASAILPEKIYSPARSQYRVFGLSSTGKIAVPSRIAGKMYMVRKKDVSTSSSVHLISPRSLSFNQKWTPAISQGGISLGIKESLVLCQYLGTYPGNTAILEVSNISGIFPGMELYSIQDTSASPASMTRIYATGSIVITVQSTTTIGHTTGHAETSVNPDHYHYYVICSASANPLLTSSDIGNDLVFQTPVLSGDTRKIDFPASDLITRITDSSETDENGYISTPADDLIDPYSISMSRIKDGIQVPIESINLVNGLVKTSESLDPGTGIHVTCRCYNRRLEIPVLDMNPLTYERRAEVAGGGYVSDPSYLDPLAKVFAILIAPRQVSHSGTERPDSLGNSSVYILPLERSKQYISYGEIDLLINAERFSSTENNIFIESTGWALSRYNGRAGLIRSDGTVSSTRFVGTMTPTGLDPSTIVDVRLEIMGIIFTTTPFSTSSSAFEVSDVRRYGGGLKDPVGGCHDISRFDGNITDLSSMVRISVPSNVVYALIDRLLVYDPEIVKTDYPGLSAYYKAVSMISSAARANIEPGMTYEIDIYGDIEVEFADISLVAMTATFGTV